MAFVEETQEIGFKIHDMSTEEEHQQWMEEQKQRMEQLDADLERLEVQLAFAEAGFEPGKTVTH
jgi:uncharacterized protein (DUF342 family)